MTLCVFKLNYQHHQRNVKKGLFDFISKMCVCCVEEIPTEAESEPGRTFLQYHDVPLDGAATLFYKENEQIVFYSLGLRKGKACR